MTDSATAATRYDAAAVEDDPELLHLMLEDAGRQSVLWQPTSYWQRYCGRIQAALDTDGLAAFRVNQAVLKGFAQGGVPRPDEPRAAWKRMLWHAAARLPVVDRLLAEHRRLLRAQHAHHVADKVRLAGFLLDRIAEAFPEFAPLPGLANGGAEDAFDWHGHAVTSDWCVHLARASAFYERVPAASVRSLLEIGSGLGLSTIAHASLNPALRMIVNVDIPPTLYISTQFLKSIGGVDVVDYRATRNLERLAPRAVAGRLTVCQIAPWQLPRLARQFDAFFNAYSFQEMEKDVCVNYARTVKPLVTRYVALHSMIAGHAPGAGAQREPVTIDFLSRLFKDEFPETALLINALVGLYEPEGSGVLLTKSD